MDIYKESITEINTSGVIIRCWRQEEKTDDETLVASEKEIRRTINEALSVVTYLMPSALAELLLSLDRMNAVEVKDAKNKNGIVFYKDWP